jgi:hypothetical protein
VAQGVRLPGGQCGGDRDRLGVAALAAALDHREDRIAGREVGDALARGAHHAGEVPAQNVGQVEPVLARARAGPHLPVGRIHAGGMDIDRDLAGPRHRIERITQIERLGPAVVVEQDRLHRGPP